MTKPSRQLDRQVKATEKVVRAWLPALDAPVTNREHMVVVGLGLRGVALYRGLLHACSGPSPTVAADAVLRTLIDLVILIRWVETSPRLHIDMWLAEDDRNRIHLGKMWNEMHRRRGSDAAAAFTPEEVAAIQAGIAETRAKAREAGEPIPARGSVMPSIERMSEVTPDLFEAYQVAYRSLSPSSHSGARSFVRDAAEERGDGLHLRPAAAWDRWHLRALAVSVMCFLVASVSRQLGLGLEKEADDFRVQHTLWSPPAADDETDGGS